MKKIIVSIIICITLIFSLTACDKPENSKEINYNGKIISLDTTQETIENILGEGEFLNSFEADSYFGGGMWYEYKYENLTISYLAEKGDKSELIANVFEWETENIKTFNNFNIGTSTKKLENDLNDYSRGGSVYTVYYTLTQNMFDISSERVSVYSYSFNDNEKISKIRISLNHYK